MTKRLRENVAKMLLLALSACALGGYGQNNVQPSFAAKKVKVTLNKKKLTLKKGQTYKLKVKKKTAKATLSWKSSKSKVVSVNSKGKLKESIWDMA